MVSVGLPSCNTYHLTWVFLTLDEGYLLTAAPAKCSRCSLPWMRGISSSFSPETPGVTGKFGLVMQNEAGQRLIEFCQENALVTTPSSNNTEDSTHGHHQMVNTKIRLIIFFAAKNGEALYSQQKQHQELTVA